MKEFRVTVQFRVLANTQEEARAIVQNELPSAHDLEVFYGMALGIPVVTCRIESIGY